MQYRIAQRSIAAHVSADVKSGTERRALSELVVLKFPIEKLEDLFDFRRILHGAGPAAGYRIGRRDMKQFILVNFAAVSGDAEGESLRNIQTKRFIIHAVAQNHQRSCIVDRITHSDRIEQKAL